MIGIINYGMGNLASVKNAFDYLNIASSIIDQPKDMAQMDKLVLPGVGAFGMAMDNLRKRNLIEPLKEQVLDQEKPILGICLGMQLFLTKSYEFGEHEGLKFIEGEAKGFSEKVQELAIPHVGWNRVKYNQNKLLGNVPKEEAVFYFVHSFYCHLNNNNEASGSTDYGIEFTSMIEKDNIFGAQFHPEKSQKFGLEIFSSFDQL